MLSGVLLLCLFWLCSESTLIDLEWSKGCRLLPFECSVSCQPELTDVVCGPWDPSVQKMFIPRSRLTLLDVPALLRCLPQLQLVVNTGPTPPEQIVCSATVQLVTGRLESQTCPKGTVPGGSLCYCSLPYRPLPGQCPRPEILTTG